MGLSSPARKRVSASQILHARCGRECNMHISYVNGYKAMFFIIFIKENDYRHLFTVNISYPFNENDIYAQINFGVQKYIEAPA